MSAGMPYAVLREVMASEDSGRELELAINEYVCLRFRVLANFITRANRRVRVTIYARFIVIAAHVQLLLRRQNPNYIRVS
jgi:hypothetical protein